jgi:thiamine-phosphate diphosphorylase/hydroxyethylthiazole kinase
VCIGGINTGNAQSVIVESRAAGRSLDGIAVVSVIMGADDPEDSAGRLLEIIRDGLPSKVRAADEDQLSAESASLYANIIKSVHDSTPLSHNMTNLVSSYFCLRSCTGFLR